MVVWPNKAVVTAHALLACAQQDQTMLPPGRVSTNMQLALDPSKSGAKTACRT